MWSHSTARRVFCRRCPLSSSCWGCRPRCWRPHPRTCRGVHSPWACSWPSRPLFGSVARRRHSTVACMAPWAGALLQAERSTPLILSTWTLLRDRYVGRGASFHSCAQLLPGSFWWQLEQRPWWQAAPPTCTCGSRRWGAKSSGCRWRCLFLRR